MATQRQMRIAEIANELRAAELGCSVAEVPVGFKFGGSDVALIMRARRLEYVQRKAKRRGNPGSIRTDPRARPSQIRHRATGEKDGIRRENAQKACQFVPAE